MSEKKPEIDKVSAATLKFSGGKKELIAFFNEIVKQGGDMLAAEALGHEWWPVNQILERDPVFRDLVERQKTLVMRKADQILCNRAMNGCEEIVEENGEVVKKTRKFNDRALLDYLKATHPKYREKALDEDVFPAIEIRRF